MNRFLPFVLLLLLFHIGQAQAQQFKDPDEFLLKDQGVPQILLVASWHFNYPGLDAHVTETENRINILSEKRQAELKVLLDYLAKFRPTKIVVEGGRNTGYLKWRWRRWKSGERPLGASEIDQIGIRLMDRLGLDTLYGANTYSVMYEHSHYRNPDVPKNYLEKLYEKQTYGGDDPQGKRYKQWYDYQDKMTVNASLLENFYYLNSDKVLDRDFGAYISTGMAVEGQYEGVDILSANWINRNLRIFRNIQLIEANPEDRILVLFGGAHIAMLKFFFECSPEFELLPFENVGK